MDTLSLGFVLSYIHSIFAILGSHKCWTKIDEEIFGITFKSNFHREKKLDSD